MGEATAIESDTTGAADFGEAIGYPGMTAEALLKRAVKAARSPRGVPHKQRWVACKYVFAIGSNAAHGLCQWAGLDPQELVR